MTDGPRPAFQRAIAGVALALSLSLGTSHLAIAASAGPAQAKLDRLEIAVVRAEDIRAIEHIQSAYGHYADRGLWEDLADLFTDDTLADYPSGIFDGKPSTRAMFVENLGAGRPGLADGRLYNHIILQPVIDLASDGKTATGRWRVLGMLGGYGKSASWADSVYRFDYIKQPDGRWKIKRLITYGGSGGGYDNGWTVPTPRPPGYVDRSPVTFNLAHPADRPRAPTCDGVSSACAAPFPYTNPGLRKSSAQLSAVTGGGSAPTAQRAADLIRRAQRLRAEQSVLNLQSAYGYYLDRGLWGQAASLFAPDGAREVGQAGVYVGRDHIRRSLELAGPAGLRPGQLNDHVQIEPVVTVAPDGLTAKARLIEIGMLGGGGEPGRLVQNIQENDYVQRGGVWMIKAVHSYTILVSDSDLGWAKSALPAPAPSTVFPPDRPPSVVYAAYPAVYTPPLSFTNPSTGKPPQYAPGTPVSPPQAPAASGAPAAVSGPLDARIATADRQARAAMDYYEVLNLQNAYGYYADKFLWGDIADLFAKGGVLEVGRTRSTGREAIVAALQAAGGPEGGAKNALDSQLQTQPVITIAADGRTAKIRSRMLELARDANGKPLWGGGVYENELVKEDGVWKFKRLHLYRTFRVPYKGGWAKAQAGEGQVIPSGFTPPFHYANPVTSR